MKFVTIKFNSGEVLKINLEQVQYIEIGEVRVDFIYQDCFRRVAKDMVLNFKEVKEIAENL